MGRALVGGANPTEAKKKTIEDKRKIKDSRVKSCLFQAIGISILETILKKDA